MLTQVEKLDTGFDVYNFYDSVSTAAKNPNSDTVFETGKASCDLLYPPCGVAVSAYDFVTYESRGMQPYEFIPEYDGEYIKGTYDASLYNQRYSGSSYTRTRTSTGSTPVYLGGWRNK